MVTDIFIFITYDKKTCSYWLEMFKFDKPECIDKLKLLISSLDVSFNIEKGQFRKYASIIVKEDGKRREGVRRESKIIHRLLTLHLLDSNLISKKGKLGHGHRIITDDLLGDKKFFRMESMFQCFGTNELQVVPELHLLYQYNSATQFIKQATCTTYDHSKSKNKFMTFLYCINFESLFRRSDSLGVD